jgi:L-2-hydroxyglutarate oxidase
MQSRLHDVVVIGGGIVGLATMLAVTERHPRLRLLILDKETEIGTHQTGHNSGVIHSGIYYRPGSEKARLCVEGSRRMIAFCEKHGIPVERCGKVIVATNEAELGRLGDLYERGVANGVQGLERIGPERLRELEPHAAGLAGIHSPGTAIVDFRAVAHAMAADARQRGVEVSLGARVVAIDHSGRRLRVRTTRGEVETRCLVNCAGLYADVLARMAGASPDVRIIPFRGEYYLLRGERRGLVRGLIYPVPDPQLPFLGVHFTRTVHGEVEAGPNAVLAFAREGYTLGHIRPPELIGTLAYRGFWGMARRHWRTGLYELWRSLNTQAFVRALQRLVPDLRREDVVRNAAGVRAQAVTPQGMLVDDFRILETAQAIHVLNAPSPAATASLSIGSRIAELAVASFAFSDQAPPIMRH